MILTDRERLRTLIARTRSVPSVMADAILRSKWLADHDEAVRQEERDRMARRLEQMDAATSSWEHFGKRVLDYAARLREGR